MDGWMINIAIALVGVVGTYAVLRNRVTRLEEDLSKDRENNTKAHEKINDRIDAGFKKQDVVIERVTVLERDTSTHLDMPKAEERFVSKAELELHLKNIELVTQHTNKTVTALVGKLEDLTALISTNVVRTLSGKNDS